MILNRLGACHPGAGAIGPSAGQLKHRRAKRCHQQWDSICIGGIQSQFSRQLLPFELHAFAV